MAYCTNCGAAVGENVNFCNSCGTAVHQTARLGYPISSNRILVLTIVSFGRYVIYWFYSTWKHYRDHTGNEAYPVWHTLTLFVPIYGLFRIHAHMRSYNELLSEAGSLDRINAGWVVTLALIAGILDNVALTLSGGWSGYEFTLGAAIVSETLFAISLILIIGVLLHAQGILNRYWTSLEDVQLVSPKFRVGEIAFVIVGLLAWSDTFQSLFSTSYRGGY